VVMLGIGFVRQFDQMPNTATDLPMRQISLNNSICYYKYRLFLDRVCLRECASLRQAARDFRYAVHGTTPIMRSAGLCGVGGLRCPVSGRLLRPLLHIITG
jgi:hypothetical protein